MEYNILVNNKKYNVSFDENIPISKLKEITLNNEKIKIDITKDFSSILLNNNSFNISSYQEIDGIPDLIDIDDQSVKIEFYEDNENGIISSKKKKTGLLRSPIPGTIIDIFVKVGDNVKKGDILCILEAMKMQNKLVSLIDGKVENIFIDKNTVVSAKEKLIEII